MKKASYKLIMISIISFLLLSIEIVGDFEPIKIRLYGNVLLFTLIIGLVLNFIATYQNSKSEVNSHIENE